jgi:hypothetical protein
MKHRYIVTLVVETSEKVTKESLRDSISVRLTGCDLHAWSADESRYLWTGHSINRAFVRAVKID